MELEKVTAEIRPRSDWEAVDLGVSLSRSHLGTLWRAWLVTVLPLSLLILLLFFKTMGWGIFLIWWLKPIWDRVALFPLSRNLFGEEPDTKATIKVLPQQLRENWVLVILGIGFAVFGHLVHRENVDGGLIVLFWLCLLGVLFYRSSIYRAFVLPVRFLEGLKGGRYRARVSLLSRRSSGAALGLTVTCVLMEIGLFLSQFFFLQFMVPEGTDWSFWQVMEDFYQSEGDAFPFWLMALIAAAYFVSMSLTSWFYTGGGFALYVNSRTWSEGWDIELAFKRLGQRIGLVVFAMSLFFVVSEVHAETSQERVEEVLASDDFEVQKGIRRDYQEDSDSIMRLSGGLGFIGALGNLLFWGVAIAIVGGIIWIIVHNAQAFGGGMSPSEKEKGQIKTLAGMPISPESLPDDILATAKKFWAEGRKKDALGLLYRGAISSMVSRDLVEIEESDTESECLRRLNGKDLPEYPYFATLTNAWVSMAYAKEDPDEGTMGQLWEEWPFPAEGRSR
ncbi:DUF4129 domain-containing protein [Akkermansiaceae bacterium]|nr:DUF4129 domain-containing protein [Akkermansiaceae bacterium]MDB4517974.1 DUF4129 domain-containing protein [Akkermansiaceae bacterium]